MLDATDKVVWFQGNLEFGNVIPVEGVVEDWQSNRRRALEILAGRTAASQLVRMRRPVRPYADLHLEPAADIIRAHALITSDPDHILNANPADCEEIALHGFSPKINKDVIAIVHADRRSVGDETYLRTLEYITGTYGLEPDALDAWISPSAREGYVMSYLGEGLADDNGWDGYVNPVEGGWHIDVHGRMMERLGEFGFDETRIRDNAEDTTTDPRYFSHFQQVNHGQPKGFNGLMFALRS
jgi:copper oxidase (laccase) domain-containing protein